MSQQQKNQPADAVHTDHHIIVGIGFTKEYEAELATDSELHQQKGQKPKRGREIGGVSEEIEHKRNDRKFFLMHQGKRDVK